MRKPNAIVKPKLIGYALAIALALAIHAPAHTTPEPSSRIPTVRFCELTTHPEKYIQKLVRTEASYVGWWESSYLYSESCKDEAHKINNAPDCADEDQKCLARFSLQWRKLKPHMRSNKSRTQTAERVKAVFIGRLFGPGEFGHLGSFKYEFRIKAVEGASPIARNVSWKGL